MVALAQAPIATASPLPLASSFLPKCTHFITAPLPLRPPVRLSFHGAAVASTKQKKKGRSSSSARDWSYEHLMVLWDEVFEQCCADPSKASLIRDLSSRGFAKHGRGCVLAFQEVQTRPRGSGTGFTSKPPKSSRRVPDFVTLDWYAVYLPREFLLDPRKAPNEAETMSSNAVTNRDADLTSPREAKAQGDDDDKDVIIDIDSYIGDALDAYPVDSDNEELDAADNINDLSDTTLDDFDDEEDSDDSNNASWFIPYDKSDAANAVPMENNAYEAPLLILDDDEPLATTCPRVETQHSNDNIIGDHNACAEALDDYEVEMSPHASQHTEAKQSEGRVSDTAHSAALLDGNTEKQFYKDDNFNATKLRSADLHEGASTSAYREVLVEEEGEHVESEVHDAARLHQNREAFAENGSVVNEEVEGSESMPNQECAPSEDDDVQLASQQMLFASMRGMDMTRLLSLTASFDFQGERFRFGRKTAMIDTKTMDAGGEDPYNPDEDELILLLHLVTDGRPAYGADIVIAERQEGDNVDGGQKNSWKLKLKYKL